MSIKEQTTVRLDKDKCKGCISCMRKCPTEAIRIKNGKAYILYERCIGCGECIRVCPHHAKHAVYDPLSLMDSFKYKIALPAPSLYGQFNNLDDVDIVLNGLENMGFDKVFEVSAGAELVSEGTRRIHETSAIPKPIISSACPAVVELILIRFHNLKDHLLPLLAPVDVAAKLAKEEAIRETGLAPSDIGVFFISPCPAKVFALRNSLGLKKPLIDGIFAQSEIYFNLVKEMPKITTVKKLHRSGIVGIGWASSGGEAAGIRQDKYLAADGIENIISVLQEIEDGKLSDIDFVELNACPSGCVGGVLNIENPFVAKAKIQTLRKYMPISKSRLKDYSIDFKSILWEKPPENLNVFKLSEDMFEAMELMKKIEELEKTLPGIDCGICGAPTCRAFAEDLILKNDDIDKCLKLKALNSQDFESDDDCSSDDD